MLHLYWRVSPIEINEIYVHIKVCFSPSGLLEWNKYLHIA